MKKTFIALATLAAAGASAAANVSLYGAADLALVYQNTKYTAEADSPEIFRSVRQSSLGLESGNFNPSKFGLKGQEDLGNGWAVRFKLENGFNADTGTLKSSGRIFDREASLTLLGPIGEISVGRMGALSSTAGTYDIFGARADAFDGGWGIFGGGYWNETDRYNNMLTYATPEVSGARLYAQYSFNTDDQEVPGARNNNRYWGVGATYDRGPLSLVAVIDSIRRQNDPNVDHDAIDSYTLSLGGNVDFGGVRAFLGAQFGRHASAMASNSRTRFFSDASIAASEDTTEFMNSVQPFNLKAHVLHAGLSADLPVGTLTGALFYGKTHGPVERPEDSSGAKYSIKSKYAGATAVYSLPLSKRTTLYTGLQLSEYQGTWTISRNLRTGHRRIKTTEFVAGLGLSHTF